MLGEEGAQPGSLLAARVTPGSPEVDEEWFARPLPEAHVLACDGIDAGKCRSRAFARERVEDPCAAGSWHDPGERDDRHDEGAAHRVTG